ncbi:MAG: SRPBCC family protein [Actinobacteria bacterium]|nr:SRPBCC family protein [Actinomycetota bacterium]
MRRRPTQHTYELERTQTVPRSVEETFAFFAQPLNLAAITPAWLHFRILEAPERLEQRSLLRYRLGLFGVPVSWRTEITRWRPPRSFTDTQLSGPYALWEHTHRFTAVRGGTEVYDNVRYRLPGGPVAPVVHGLLVRRWLRQIFDFRAARLEALLGGGGDDRAPR